MKLIASGVTFSAAIVRSPSFSRSSSSTTTTIFPTRMSSTASGMLLKGDTLSGPPRRQERLDILRDHVSLDVHAIADAGVAHRRMLKCIRDERDCEGAPGRPRDGQRDPVHGHGA